MSKKIKESLINLDKETIYQFIVDNLYADIKYIIKKTNAKYNEVEKILTELVLEEKICLYKNEYHPIYKTRISIKTAGYAFAYVDDEKYYYIDKDSLNNVYNGDICYVFPKIGYKGVEGEIYKVIERGNKYIVGFVKLKNKKNSSYLYITSEIISFPVTINIPFNQENLEYVGSLVKAEVIYNKKDLGAKIIEKLGTKDDPGIEITAIAAEYGFKVPFCDEVIEEIKNIPDEVLPVQFENRRDFRNLNIITIDGDDSKDFDDAVYLEILPNGNYSLGVFIADVAEYVGEDTALDKEALQRGTSVYLADRVIPMLPKKLSNGICSLNESVDRLVLACIMEIDSKGKLVNYDICEGVINSHHRMTYNKVNKILNGDLDLINEYADIVDMLRNMRDLSVLIRELRHKKGGIEFDTTEYKFELNLDGSPKSIIKRERADSEKLIEDFMLMANETIAYHMNIMNLPIVYRVHEKPEQEKLHQVFATIASMNVKVKNIKNDIHPKQIQTLLEDVKDNPNHEIINNMLLRSMMKAKYHEKCLGHYGLAMNYYCHFTSPIRRYPDLMTHRMIKKLLLHPANLEYDLIKYNAIIPDIALLNSASERKAVDCERTVDDMLCAWYMEKFLGKKFEGTITSIAPFGMFVTLENGIEGLISFKNMSSYVSVSENLLSAYDDFNTYHIGDRVKIIVVDANKETRKIDFVLKSEYEDDEYENNLYK
ncbi:MAG: ribonuclease R [Anaeroplasma sp.]